MVESRKIQAYKQLTEAEARRRVAVHLQAIEGNPLDANQVAMFEREGWSHERRLAHIRERAKAASKVPAAE